MAAEQLAIFVGQRPTGRLVIELDWDAQSALGWIYDLVVTWQDSDGIRTNERKVFASRKEMLEYLKTLVDAGELPPDWTGSDRR